MNKRLKLRIVTIDGGVYHYDRPTADSKTISEREAADAVWNSMWSEGHFFKTGDYINSITAIPPWQIKEVNLWVEESS